MAHEIDTDKCLKCGACKDACPVEAISEQNDVYVIDEALCVDCGACEGGCPADAIKAK